MSQQFRMNNPSINFTHFHEAIYQGQASQFYDAFQQPWDFPGADTTINPVPRPTGAIQTVRAAPPVRTASRVSIQQGNKRAQYDNIDPNLQDPRFLSPPGSNVFPAVHNHPEPSADPLTRFYQEDEPWNHIRYSNANVGRSAFNQPHRSFGQNNRRPCSDIGSNIPASDSGYYTQQTRSVLSGEPGRVHQELPSDIMNQTRNLNVESSSAEAQAMTRRASSQRSVSHYSGRSASQKQQFPCPESGCTIVSKCQSEYKKHMLKHHKVFKCDVSGCKREQKGFSTTNDLDRHKKSVHKIGMDKLKSWRCAAVSCSNKEKTWPRLDNFKQHIERMHKDEEQIDLIRRSEYDPQDAPPAPQPMSVDPAHLLAGMGTEPSVATGVHNDISLYTASQSVSYPEFMSFSGRSISNNSQVSPSTDTMDFSFPRSGSTSMANAAGSFPPRQGLPNAAIDLPGNLPTSRKSSQLSHDSATRNRPSAPKPTGVQKSTRQLTLSTDAQTKSEQQREALGKLSKAITQEIKTSTSTAGSATLEELVFRALCAQQQNEKVSENASKGPSSGSKTTNATMGTQRCPHPECQFVGRNCDLNKHIKRHLKPFGCTYPKCYKRFGAKSDWKRHENSQHFQQEAYRCDYDDVSKRGEKCGQHFYRAAQFQKHLGEHKVSSVDQIQAGLKRCKIGKNCQGQYWCGFCNSIKTLERRRNEAWDERFDHIAHHFDKEKKCIDDWICVEENRTKEQIHTDIKRGLFVDDEAGSSDGEKEDDNGLTTTFDMSKATPEAGPSSVQTARGKRKAHGEVIESQRATKQKKRVTTVVVYCCQCGYGGSRAVQSGCVDCQHNFCNSCRAEEVASLSFDN